MKRILIVYHSQQSGNTAKMADLVARGCREAEGVEAELVNVNETRVDMGAAEGADAYALGSPNYYSYPAGGLKQFFDDIYIAQGAGRKMSPKPYVAFCTHGGGGSINEIIEKLAASMKLQKVAPGLAARGAPEGEAVAESIALGRALGEYVSAQA